jgi:hypothetical protein
VCGDRVRRLEGALRLRTSVTAMLRRPPRVDAFPLRPDSDGQGCHRVEFCLRVQPCLLDAIFNEPRGYRAEFIRRGIPAAHDIDRIGTRASPRPRCTSTPTMRGARSRWQIGSRRRDLDPSLSDSPYRTSYAASHLRSLPSTHRCPRRRELRIHRGRLQAPLRAMLQPGRSQPTRSEGLRARWLRASLHGRRPGRGARVPLPHAANGARHDARCVRASRWRSRRVSVSSDWRRRGRCADTAWR